MPAMRNLREANRSGSSGLDASIVFPSPPMSAAVINAVKGFVIFMDVGYIGLGGNVLNYIIVITWL